MSIELKEAAQQAVDAFEAFGDADDFASLFELTQKMRALRTALQQAEAQQPATGEPVYWEWRHLGNNQFAADFGQWSEWKRVEARNPIFTAEDELRTLRRYIADGYKYELRALYTTPQPDQATLAEVTDERIIAIKKSIRAVDPTQPWGDTLAFARAILALRPGLVPMTDEQIRPMCKQGWVFETVRQWVHVIESHHGISAKAKGEQ